MYHFTFYRKMAVIICLFLSGLSFAANAQENACTIKDRACILQELKENTSKIENTSWRDQTYRELAKTYAFEKEFEQALTIIDLVQTPDIKAMSIRGVGMMLAHYKDEQAELTKKFAKLRVKADSIAHPPSHGIALTYIAMAQAFAGDNEGAWKTTESMKNSALRNKAYGETAEIQAERGDFKSAQTSIQKISSLSFRNKAYEIISKILSDKQLYQDAYDAAKMIENNYKRGQAIQYMLDSQQPRDRVQ